MLLLKIIKKKTNLISILSIVLFASLEIFLVTRNGKAFVSMVDYYKQSIAFANYFRNLFYETGQLLPNFAFHIGAGQNLYYFAYYGLFSPITFFSYLLPHINILDYIMVVTIMNIVCSGILMYLFLLKNQFKEKNALIGALLLVSSCSFLFYSHRHIMFTDYMSFFILSLLGVKIYHEKGKSILLIIGVFLTILTSYYFSIPCILCLFIYDLYLNIEISKNKLKILFLNEVKFGVRIFIAILLSAFLLLPILYTLTARTATPTSNTMPFLTLFFFKIPSENLFYSQRGIGLNTIVLIALLFNLLFLHKQNRILALILLILFGFPFFNYAFNGFMYLNAKVFIPFLPIFILFVINTVEKIDKINWKSFFLFILITLLFSFVFVAIKVNKVNFILNVLFNFLLLYLYKKRKNTLYLLPIVLLCSAFTIKHFQKDTRQATQEQYQMYKNDLVNAKKEFIIEDSIYRYQNNGAEYMNLSDANLFYLPSVYSSISNSYHASIYNTSFYNNFTSRHFSFFTSLTNPFYLRFMGVKYNYSSSQIYGSKQITNDEDKNLFVNENVFPIGFFRNELLNVEEYHNLTSIEKVQAYQNNIIIEGKSSNSNLNFVHEDIVFDLREILDENFSYQEHEGHFLFNTIEKEITYSLEEPLLNKTLIIQFKVNNNPICKQDEIIKINGIRNILTCDTYEYHNGNHTFNYVIGSDRIEELKINITEGFYDISDLEIYTIDNRFFNNIPDTAFMFDKEKTKGDTIEGSISVPSDGYVIFTIPYDQGFTLYVDNKQEEIELVNEGFVGFKIKEGEYRIKLTFTAPYSNIGKGISIFGILCFFALIFYERRI